jgi:hypothetical protein
MILKNKKRSKCISFYIAAQTVGQYGFWFPVVPPHIRQSPESSFSDFF